MPFIIADRVRETSTTVGTGSIALAGAVTGYRTFASVMASTDTTYYTIADQGGPNWEVGIGTFTSPSTLARTTVLSSSNGGSLVNFTSGTKDVFISLTASRTNVSDQPNVIDTNSSSAALRITQTGTGNALVVEDSANPDATPFAVDATGVVGIGEAAPGNFVSAGMVLRSGTSSTPVIFNWNATNDTAASSFAFRKDRAGALVQSGDLLGLLRWQGLDGLGYRTAAQITGEVDGTPGAADMPGRLVFGTTADGAFIPTERMRIDNAGQVRIGSGTVAAPALSVLTDTNTGIYFPAADTVAIVEGGTEVMRADSSANVLINTTTAVSRLTVNGDVAGTFFVNPTTVSANYTIPTNYNAMTAGPITVNSGVTVTVPSGSTWTVV